MKLVVLPLSVPGPEGKKKMFDKVVELAEQIPDEEQRTFILSAMTLATDRLITRK